MIGVVRALLRALEERPGPKFVRHIRRAAIEAEMRRERPRVDVPEEVRRHEFTF